MRPRERHPSDLVRKRLRTQRRLGKHNNSSDLTQDDVQGANHQQVALKLLADLLLDAVVHVRGVVRVELVDEDLLGQLDGEAVPVDGDLLHQLATLDPHWNHTERVTKKIKSPIVARRMSFIVAAPRCDATLCVLSRAEIKARLPSIQRKENE